MESSEIKFSALTEKIIGCAMKVHRHFGVGFPEIVYQRALVIELEKNGLKCDQELTKDIFYDGVKVYQRRLDLLVEDQVLIETKALKELDKSDMVQTLNYLKVFKLEVGLLLNFGATSLYFKRYANTL